MDGTEREKTTVRETRGFASIGDITGDLLRNAIILVRNEVRMGVAEITNKVTGMGKHSTLLGIGIFVAYAGFFFVLAAAAFGLAKLIPPAWAVLVVGVVTLIVGGILFFIGKKRLNTDVLPHETIDTAREDTTWMRNQLS